MGAIFHNFRKEIISHNEAIMKQLLEKILEECSHYKKEGKVACYIPELAKANVEDFGICIVSENETYDVAGDFDKPFTAQSIIKPMILLLALEDHGLYNTLRGKRLIKITRNIIRFIFRNDTDAEILNVCLCKLGDIASNFSFLFIRRTFLQNFFQ